MGVKKVTLFIWIINYSSIRDKWEVTGFNRIPVAVDEFPIERASWGNGVKFLQDGMNLCCGILQHEFFFVLSFSAYCI